MIGMWADSCNSLMKLRFQQNEDNFFTSSGPVMFSGRTLHHGVSVCRNTDKPYLLMVRVMHEHFLYPKYYINCGQLNELNHT
jgi:hypothetical protein